MLVDLYEAAIHLQRHRFEAPSSGQGATTNGHQNLVSFEDAAISRGIRYFDAITLQP